jgi:polysaccharide pyruvyl transferase WcaK-like protein
VTRAAPVIGVWGHFADANLGDDACPTALIQHLGQLIPTARFVLFCRFPAVAQATWGLPAYPVRPLSPGADVPRLPHAPPPRAVSRWRRYARGVPLVRAVVRTIRGVVVWGRAVPAELRFAWQSYRSLRGVDLLVVTGSNPLFDFFGGFWGYPFRTWQWARLARLTGTRVAFVSVGAGPIVSARSGRLLARVLRRAAYVSFRDEGSRRLMREHGFDGPDHVCPDLAHSLPFDVRPGTRSERLRVGINPMIVHNPEFWPVASCELHGRYVESLAALASTLIASGHDVFFYGTQAADQVSAQEVQLAMRAAAPALPLPPFVMPASINQLFELCASADLLVTTRFHGAIFGIRAARPTLAICYQWKTREVLEVAGLGAHAIDFEQVTPERLRAAFDRLCAERHRVETDLRRHVTDLRARLDRQYDQVAGLVQRDAQRASFLRYQSRKPDVAGSLS